MEDHAVSLGRNRYALFPRRDFLGAFSVLLALALFDPGVATAQQGKEIKLTEQHIQSFLSAYTDMVKVYESADPDKPDDAKVEAQAEAIAKKNGFASLAEFDDVSVSISAVLSGIDPQTRKFTEPPEQLKKEIAALRRVGFPDFCEPCRAGLAQPQTLVLVCSLGQSQPIGSRPTMAEGDHAAPGHAGRAYELAGTRSPAGAGLRLLLE